MNHSSSFEGKCLKAFLNRIFTLTSKSGACHTQGNSSQPPPIHVFLAELPIKKATSFLCQARARLELPSSPNPRHSPHSPGLYCPVHSASHYPHLFQSPSLQPSTSTPQAATRFSYKNKEICICTDTISIQINHEVVFLTLTVLHDKPLNQPKSLSWAVFWYLGLPHNFLKGGGKDVSLSVFLSHSPSLPYISVGFGHIGLCLGLTSGSVLRDRSLLAGIKSRLGVCKARA